MLFRSASAAAHSLASKPRLAVVSLAVTDAVFGFGTCYLSRTAARRFQGRLQPPEFGDCTSNQAGPEPSWSFGDAAYGRREERARVVRGHGYAVSLFATLIAASNPFFSFTALTRAFCRGPSWRM
jgi:hypothetical protein